VSSTSQVTTFSDLYTDMMNRAREDTGQSATVTQAKRYINIALHDIHLGQGEKYPWAERIAVLVTQPQYTTGTVTVTQGDTALTGTGTAWDTANAFGLANMRSGGKIVINGGNEVYEIDAVTSDTTATLTSDFVQDDVTDGTYVYFEDEYTLATDFLRPIDQQKFDSEASIDLIGRTEFRRRYPSNKVTGKPVIATLTYRPIKTSDSGTITSTTSVGGGTTVWTNNTLADGDHVTIAGTTSYNGTWTITLVTGLKFVITATYVADETGTWTTPQTDVRRVRFHPPPSEATMVRYSYVTSNLARTNLGVEQASMSSDSDEPIMPLQYRHAIVFHALAHWYRDKHDDARSQEAMNEYSKIMLRIIGDQEIGGAKPRFVPRVGTYRRRAKSPWSGGFGRYDLNGRFDRME